MADDPQVSVERTIVLKRARPRRWLWLAAAILVVALLIFFLRPRTPEVSVATVEAKPVSRVLAVNGRIRPRLSVEVRSRVAGTLVELGRDVGDSVATGELLGRIDDAPQRAAIGQAAAAVEARRAELAQARRDLARFEALGQFTTRQRVEQARVAVRQGEADVARLSAAVAQARDQRERHEIRAPFSGIVLDRPVDPGQTVGLDTIIYRLADLAAPEVEAEVDEIYAAELREGMPAWVQPPGMNRRRAFVAHVEPRVDPTTGARVVRLRLADPLPSAPAGLTTAVGLVVEQRPRAIAVPRSAILQAGGAPRVLLLDGDRVIARPIRFIDWPAPEVIVTAGLSGGERLVLDPTAVQPGERAQAAD